MFTFILLFTGLLMYLSLYTITRDKLNPQAIFLLLWYLPASLSSAPILYNFDLQNVWDTKMMFVVYFSGVAFYIPSLLLAQRVKPLGDQKINFSNAYIILFNTLMLISIIAFIFRFTKAGHGPSLFSGYADLKNANPPFIRGWVFFELFIPYLSIVAFFEINVSNKISSLRKKILISYIFFSLFIWAFIFNVSRGSIVPFIFAAAYFYNRKYTISWRKLLVTFILLLIAVSSFSLLRLNNNSLVLSNFGKSSIISMAFSSFYTYTAFNFENLNQLISSNTPMTGWWYSWKFLLKPFFYSDYENNTFDFHDYNVLYFNARTYLYGFYHDLHTFGIIFYPFLLGILISVIVRMANHSMAYILLLMALQKAIIFTSFGNYFTFYVRHFLRI